MWHRSVRGQKARRARTKRAFEAAANLYEAKHVSTLRSGTAAYVKRELRAARDEFCKRTLASITKRDLIALIDAADESGPHAGTQRRKVLAAFFRWACDDRDLIQSNPARGLPKRQFKARERFLDDGELRIVWQAAERENGRYGALVKLLILTGCRRNEIARLHGPRSTATISFLSPDRTKTAGAASGLLVAARKSHHRGATPARRIRSRQWQADVGQIATRKTAST